MTSFVASPGHQHPQYCNNVIHSVYNHKKRSEGLSGYWKSETDQALPFQILFVFVLVINGWFIQFHTLFWGTECNSLAKQHCPTHSIVVRWGQNRVDCSYFFNFEGCILATQIHQKMLMVVDHMTFFSWAYTRSTCAKLYVTLMYQCVYGN